MHVVFFFFFFAQCRDNFLARPQRLITFFFCFYCIQHQWSTAVAELPPSRGRRSLVTLATLTPNRVCLTRVAPNFCLKRVEPMFCLEGVAPNACVRTLSKPFILMVSRPKTKFRKKLKVQLDEQSQNPGVSRSIL